VSDHFCVCLDLIALVSASHVQTGDDTPFVYVSGFVAGKDGRCAADAAQVLLEAYAKYGDKVTAHVLGQYAAVIVDRARGSVLLVQDSLGVRPLFYSLLEKRLWVASRLDELVRRLPTSPLDDEYFADLLGSGHVFSERTPWIGIERLLMGQSARFGAGGDGRRYRPWIPSASDKSVGDDLGSKLRGMLDDAIAACLPAGKKIACELSGGLDSTTVLAFARRLDEVLAVTFASERHPDVHDVRYAREAAEALGSRQATLNTDDQQLFDRSHVQSTREPGSEMFAAKLAAIDHLLVENGVDILLTGWAGDVVFGSAAALPHHLADGIARGRPWQSIEATISWHKAFPSGPSWTRWFTSFALRSAWRHRRGVVLNIPNVSVELADWLDADFVKRLKLRDRARRQHTARVSRPGAQYLWQTIYGIAAMHASSGRLGLSVDTRHPLLYRPLVEFMLNVDNTLRHPGGRDRVLQRRALNGVLPEAIRLRRTKGGMGGELERNIAHDRELLQLLAENPRIVARGYVDATRWRETVERASVGAINNRLLFDLTVSIELWLRHYCTATIKRL
jgi:asparagine synthase (glutamine-hydrolysing)